MQLLHSFMLSIAGAFACTLKALEKNRRPTGWAIAGFLLPGIAFIAALAVRSLAPGRK
jgi:hypothetical protein